MINVKFLGLVQLLITTKETMVDSSTVDEALKIISRRYDIKLSILKNSIILVNEINIVQLRKFKTRLYDGDEIIILSPGGGG